MAYRNELKYLINSQQQTVISKRLSLLCQPDPYALEDGGYTVSSLYFDDFENVNFAAKLDGNQIKKKFRIRIYNYSKAHIKLERKIKQGSATKKDTMRISLEEYQRILSGGQGSFPSASSDVMNDFLRLKHMRRLSPRVIVTYHRKVFVYPYGDVRLCFDTRLRTPLSGLDLFAQSLDLQVMDPIQAIFEIKYTGFLPEIIKTAVQSGFGNKQAYSKYAQCMLLSKKGVHHDI